MDKKPVHKVVQRGSVVESRVNRLLLDGYDDYSTNEDHEGYPFKMFYNSVRRCKMDIPVLFGYLNMWGGTVDNSVFIPNNVPSLKNSKQFVYNKKLKRGILLPSSTVSKYLSATDKYWRGVIDDVKHMIDSNSRVKLKMGFIRDSARIFDLINAAQIVQDLLVKHDMIADDNANHLIPEFDDKKPYIIDKKNAGIIITFKTLEN